MAKLKTLVRDALPGRWQVPIRYLYTSALGHLEREMALLEDLVAYGDHVVDVGGNRGIYAYRFFQLGAEVDVFEPNPNCAAVLKDWAASRANITVHQVALSDRAGTARLHVPIDEHGLEHDASATIGRCAVAKTHDFAVETRLLDEFGFEAPALMKIDVEGHEGSVIEGAWKTLLRAHPVLIVEIEQRHNATPIGEIFARLESAEYCGFFMDGMMLSRLEEFNLDRDQAIGALGKSDAYHNNFIFIGAAKLKEGQYEGFLKRWVRS